MGPRRRAGARRRSRRSGIRARVDALTRTRQSPRLGDASRTSVVANGEKRDTHVRMTVVFALALFGGTAAIALWLAVRLPLGSVRTPPIPLVSSVVAAPALTL